MLNVETEHHGTNQSADDWLIVLKKKVIIQLQLNKFFTGTNLDAIFDKLSSMTINISKESRKQLYQDIKLQINLRGIKYFE